MTQFMAIKAYLQQHKIASLVAIATHIGVTPETAEQMLAVWHSSGQVIEFKPSGCGHTCQQCIPQYAKEYRWVSNLNEPE